MNQYTLKFHNKAFETEYQEHQIDSKKLFFFLFTIILILIAVTDIIQGNNDRKTNAFIYLSVSIITLALFFSFNRKISIDFLFVLADINVGFYLIRVT